MIILALKSNDELVFMKIFKVLIEGNNCIICLDGKTGRYGFFTTRFIEAKDLKGAETTSISMIRNELKAIVLNSIDDPPAVYIEEINDIDDIGKNIMPGSGFTWFESEETIH